MDKKLQFKCICCGSLFLVIGVFFYRTVICPSCGGNLEKCFGDLEENPDVIIDKHGTIVIYSENKANSGTETTAYSSFANSDLPEFH